MKVIKSFFVDPSWNKDLGLTDEQIADLTLRDFARLCFDKGIKFELKRFGGVGPGLTLEDKKPANESRRAS